MFASIVVYSVPKMLGYLFILVLGLFVRFCQKYLLKESYLATITYKCKKNL